MKLKSLLLALIVGTVFPLQASCLSSYAATPQAQKPFSFVEAPAIQATPASIEIKAPEVPAKRTITINAGTRVPVSVYNTVNSNNLNQGDMIAMAVSSDVKVDGVTVFKKGSEGVLFVSKSIKGRGHGGKGILEIDGGRVYDALGNDYNLNLSINRQGVGKRGWAIVATVLGIALILVPFGVWIDGSPASLQGGGQFDALVTTPKTIEI